MKLMINFQLKALSKGFYYIIFSSNDENKFFIEESKTKIRIL